MSNIFDGRTISTCIIVGIVIALTALGASKLTRQDRVIVDSGIVVTGSTPNKHAARYRAASAFWSSSICTKTAKNPG